MTVTDGQEAPVAGGRGAGMPRVALTLFVDGASERSARAICDARRLCAEHLPGEHHLDVVDIREQRMDLRGERVLAVPMLVRERPLPVRRIAGSLSPADRVLDALDLR